MLRLPSAFVAAVIEPAWDLWERSARLRTFRRLQSSQWQEPEQLRRLRSERLRRLVVHADANSPFYARRFRASGIDPQRVQDIADLAGLPPLTKDEVRHEQADIVSRSFRRDALVPAKTGGSTGVALQVFCDRPGVQMRAAAALRADTWSGWRLGEPVAAVWGNPPEPRTWRNRLRRALKDRIFFLDTMRIDDRSIARFVAEWRRWRPGLLYGHAHSLFILAEALAIGGTALRPRGVVATSMMLLQSERRVIEKTFGVPVTDRYGCEEVSLIACECEVHRGLHVNAEHVIVEVLRDDGSSCAAGEEGLLVVTELINQGMPMIRYELQDRGIASERVCSCGRSLPLLEAVTGRTADFLLATDGSRVAGISLIERTLTRFEGIKQLQLIQVSPEALNVNLVPADGYDTAVARALTAGLQESLGRQVAVSIRLADRILPDRSGKYRFAIRQFDD